MTVVTTGDQPTVATEGSRHDPLYVSRDAGDDLWRWRIVHLPEIERTITAPGKHEGPIRAEFNGEDHIPIDWIGIDPLPQLCVPHRNQRVAVDDRYQVAIGTKLDFIHLMDKKGKAG